MDALLFSRSALERFAAAGLEVEVANARRAKAAPTPKSKILEGAVIDALPVAETEIMWCTLMVR